jgi:hypothetical protein
MFSLGSKSSKEEADAAVDRVKEQFSDAEVEVVEADRRFELRINGAVGADFKQEDLGLMRHLVQEHIIKEPEGHPKAGQVRNAETAKEGGDRIVEGSDAQQRQTAPVTGGV